MHLYGHKQLFVVPIDTKIWPELRKNPSMSSQTQAVWNRSVVPECINGCSRIPCLLPRTYGLFEIMFCRACRSPVVCSLALHSALVTEPMILLGWQFRKFSLLVSLGTWMLFFSGSFPICPFLGHGLFIFWLSDTELDQDCLTMALVKSLTLSNSANSQLSHI